MATRGFRKSCRVGGRQPRQGVKGEVRHPKEAGKTPAPGGEKGTKREHSGSLFTLA